MSQRSRLLTHLRKVIKEKQNYPLGTLVYFGPDDMSATKIVAIVMPSPETDPILEQWTGPSITDNQQVVMEIGHFFQQHQVQEIVMANGIVGCPHEEGVDYPQGEDCPHCPFWAES